MRISDWSSDVCSSDLSSIRVYDTPVGPLGTLACGENTNTLARFALLSQGELVHVANYIALPVAPASYNMAEAIKIRATAHRSEEHTSELQSLKRIAYAVFCLKKKNRNRQNENERSIAQ